MLSNTVFGLSFAFSVKKGLSGTAIVENPSAHTSVGLRHALEAARRYPSFPSDGGVWTASPTPASGMKSIQHTLHNWIAALEYGGLARFLFVVQEAQQYSFVCPRVPPKYPQNVPFKTHYSYHANVLQSTKMQSKSMTAVVNPICLSQLLARISVPPSHQNLISSVSLGAACVGERGDLFLLQCQQSGPSDHSSIVDTITVISRVQLASPL